MCVCACLRLHELPGFHSDHEVRDVDHVFVHTTRDGRTQVRVFLHKTTELLIHKQPVSIKKIPFRITLMLFAIP